MKESSKNKSAGQENSAPNKQGPSLEEQALNNTIVSLKKDVQGDKMENGAGPSLEEQALNNAIRQLETALRIDGYTTTVQYNKLHSTLEDTVTHRVRSKDLQINNSNNSNNSNKVLYWLFLRRQFNFGTPEQKTNAMEILIKHYKDGIFSKENMTEISSAIQNGNIKINKFVNIFNKSLKVMQEEAQRASELRQEQKASELKLKQEAAQRASELKQEAAQRASELKQEAAQRASELKQKQEQEAAQRALKLKQEQEAAQRALKLKQEQEQEAQRASELKQKQEQEQEAAAKLIQKTYRQHALKLKQSDKINNNQMKVETNNDPIPLEDTKIIIAKDIIKAYKEWRGKVIELKNNKSPLEVAQSFHHRVLGSSSSVAEAVAEAVDEATLKEYLNGIQEILEKAEKKYGLDGLEKIQDDITLWEKFCHLCAKIITLGYITTSQELKENFKPLELNFQKLIKESRKESIIAM